MLRPEDREGGKYQVHEAIEVSYVNRKGLDYRLGTKKLEWPDQGSLHCNCETTLWMFVLRV